MFRNCKTPSEPMTDIAIKSECPRSESFKYLVNKIGNVNYLPQMYPIAVMHGIFDSSDGCAMHSTRAPMPPVFTTSCVNSKECRTMSLTKAAAFLRTMGQACAMWIKTLGKTSASTTTSANSVLCFAMLPSLQRNEKMKKIEKTVGITSKTD